MITVDVTGRETATVDGLYRYDYGQVLYVIDSGACMTDGMEVDFYQDYQNEIRYLENSQVKIPDTMLENDSDILAYIYIRSLSQGETKKVIRMTVKDRPKPANTETPDNAGNYQRLIPPGGEAGQVLAKRSEKDYDVEWKTGSGGEAEAIPQELIDELFNAKGE